MCELGSSEMCPVFTDTRPCDVTGYTSPCSSCSCCNMQGPVDMSPSLFCYTDLCASSDNTTPQPLSLSLVCMCVPSPLPGGVYVSCVCCVLLLALCSCLQVYTNRLRRVIAAFYYPAVHTHTDTHTLSLNSVSCSKSDLTAD